VPNITFSNVDDNLSKHFMGWDQPADATRLDYNGKGTFKYVAAN